MKVLIIGASGLVGSNCLKYFNRQKGTTVIGTYFSYKANNTVFFDTLNLENPGNFDVEKFFPDVIIHCGALTHVDYCEDHVAESYQKTVVSTMNVIELCLKSGAKMVYISTDYVFDGTAGPYDENAEINPISVYGSHKLEAERAVLSGVPGSVVIRITNVYGDEERKKNFVVRIVDQLLQAIPVRLTLPVDQYATPVNAWDVARALYLLATDGKSGIYNIAGSDYLNRVELAEKIRSHFPKADLTYKSLTTAQLNQQARRPLKGGLKNDKFIGEYPLFKFSTVDDYLKSVQGC